MKHEVDMIWILFIVISHMTATRQTKHFTNFTVSKLTPFTVHHLIPVHATPNIGCGGDLNFNHRNNTFYLNSPPFTRIATFCIWNIKLPFGKQVKFVFEHFLLLSELQDCEDAYFEIRDITGIRRFCKSGPLNKEALSRGPETRVTLFSWQTRDFDEGIRIRIEVGNAPCHLTYWNIAQGSFFSPNYPNTYPDNAVCTWKIRVPKTYFIQLNCLHKFWIENSANCESDVLLISLEGRDDFHNALKFCGRRNPQLLESENNMLTILFKSNAYFHYSGFRCNFLANNVEETSAPSVSTDFPIDPNICGVCGIAGSNSISRIVGGYITAVNQFPWMVAILNRGANNSLIQECGGSLINDRYVISAAHCFTGKKPENIAIDLGDHNLTDDTESPAMIVNVEKILLHPQFGKNGITNNNDIAIIKMEQSVSFTNQMRPICLSPASISFDNQIATVAGWGKTDTNSPSSDILRAAEVRVVPLETCRVIYGFNRITENILCAGSTSVNRPTDACGGDSGGPLMWFENNRWYLIGVVSSGPPSGTCGDLNFPGLYTRMSNYLQWIGANTQQDSLCAARRLDGTI